MDATGKNVLVANYGSGSVACLPIDTDGRLRGEHSFIQHKVSGTDPRRQNSPHAHSINLDAAGRFAVVADLGLDRVFVYKFNPAEGRLAPTTRHSPRSPSWARATSPFIRKAGSLTSSMRWRTR